MPYKCHIFEGLLPYKCHIFPGVCHIFQRLIWQPCGEGETKGGETGGGEPRAIGTGINARKIPAINFTNFKAMVCYHDETVLKRCVGNCLFAKCSSGIHSKIDIIFSFLLILKFSGARM
jgi:hypothetical protein